MFIVRTNQNMRICIISLCLILCSFLSFSINEGVPIIKNFKAEDYSGGSRIYSILSTEEGILYAGDKNGILEFDGENWHKIHCGFTVSSLAIDSSNVVHVAGSEGIGILSLDSTNTMVYKSLNHLISTEKKIRRFRYSEVFNVQNQIVYVLRGEIIINTPESIRIIEIPYNFSYYQKLNNELFFYSPEEGIYKLIDNKLSIINDNVQIKNRNIRAFLTINNVLHAFIVDFGIYNLEDNKLIPFHDVMPDLNLKRVQGAVQLDDSTYALKTYYNGVVMINSKGEIVKKYHYDEGLSNNTVFSVFKDSWSNLWVGTASGISVIRLNFPFTKFNDQQGIGTGYSSVLFNDKLYLATSQGLYFAKKDVHGHMKFEKLFDGHVWGLHIIEDVLYFGSASGIFSLKNDLVRRISNYPGAWGFTQIPHDKNFYLTGTPVGIILLRNGFNGTLEFVRLVEGLEANIENIEIDSEGYYWAEFDKGLYRFSLNRELTKIENYRSFDRIELNNKLKKVRKYRNELLFIADSGIYKHNSIDGFWKDSIYNRKELLKEYPSTVVVDRFDRLWFFSHGNATCYTVKNNRLVRLRYDRTDYAKDTYPKGYENVFSVDSNFVIIGQEEGFIGYNLSSKYKGTLSSNRIRKVIIKTKDGKERNITGRVDFVNGSQYSKASEGLRYRSTLKFYYSAGSSKFNSVKYSTFLYGFDKEWTAWNNENFKEYTNLPKGDYKFIVRSVNRLNEESIPAVFDFKILPPWYLTIVAKIVYVILLVLLVFITERLIRYRSINLQKKIQKEQDEEASRKEQDRIYEDLKKEKEIIKLRNEKLRIDNLYKSKELANSTMGVIKKNQFLTDLRSELEKIMEYSEKNKLVTGDIKDVIRRIDRDINNEENWKVFEDYFDKVHEKFLNRMKTHYPILTANDLRLSAYLRMNLSTKEIAPLMNITVRGVEISRYRLRKKLQLERDDNLYDFLLKF